MSSDPDRVLDAVSPPALPDERPNTPVPDELNFVREEMKRLEIREAELRRLLIMHPDLRTGAAWLAEINEVIFQQPDLKQMRAANPAFVEEHTHPVTRTNVKLSGITEDGEIISARRARAIRKPVAE